MVNNTPEKEISRVDKSCVQVDEKFCGGESNSCQNRLVSENRTSEKEIFAVSGGVDWNKIALVSNPVEN